MILFLSTSLNASPLDDRRLFEEQKTIPPTVTGITPLLTTTKQQTSLKAAWALRSGSAFLFEHPLIAAMDRVAVTGSTFYQIFATTWKTEGILGFWSGGSTALIRSAFWGPRLFAYDATAQNLSSLQRSFLLPALMCSFDTFLIKPINTVRIAMTTATPKTPFSLTHAFKPKQLYRAFLPVMASNYIGWYTYLLCDKKIRETACNFYQQKSLNHAQAATAGIFTTFITGMLTAPIKLIIIPMQSPIYANTSFVNIFKQTWHQQSSIKVVRFALFNALTYLPGNVISALTFNHLDDRRLSEKNKNS